MENFIIYLKEAGAMLKYEDKRSVKEWCEKMNVKIFVENFTNRKYILYGQFIHAYSKEIIEYLEQEYGIHWPEAFKAYMNLDLLWIIKFERSANALREKSIQGHKFSGTNGNKFLKVLTDLTSELYSGGERNPPLHSTG